MSRKEQAMQEIMVLLKNNLDYTNRMVSKFEEFFDNYLAENSFEKAAEAKLTLGKLLDFRQVVEAAINTPSRDTIERFIIDSGAFAKFCESMT